MSSRLAGLRSVVVALTFLALGAGTAAAQKGKAAGAAKPASACGIKLLPLTVGNTWTYEPIPLPPEAQPPEAQARFLPPQFKKVVVTVDQHANTSAASVPLALDVAVRDGRVKKGDLVVLEAMGGGFTWGAAVVRY